MFIKDYVLEQKDYMIKLRRYFHQNPEISLLEYNTASRIEEELDKLEIPHKRIGKTGVLAYIEHILDNDNSRTIALRADIDALRIQEKNDNIDFKSVNDGIMHACGHDAHAAALLGAAKILKSMEAQINGKVLFIFQQAEEIGGGAKHFIENNILDGVDRILGIHVASYLNIGKIGINQGESNASCDYFKIKVTGKSAHVSKPHTGIDAVYIASQIVVALQSIVARNLDPLESGVVGIGKFTAGTNYNIIANEAVLEGTTRAFNNNIRKLINDKVSSIAKLTAETYGATAEVEFIDYASPLVNDLEVTNEISEVAGQIVSNENIIKNAGKNMMADDFAEYLLNTKGAYVFVGSSKDESTSYPHHHEKFNIDEEAILVSANLYVDYVKKTIIKGSYN